MAKRPEKRLGRALEHASDLAQQIEAAMPPPKPKRTKKAMVYLSEDEHSRIEAYAEERDEPFAVVMRNLILVSLKALGK